LADLLPFPPNVAYPLLQSPPPADAVGSYGLEAEAWIQAEFGVRLRHWQRWALRLQWAHRRDGSLCYGTVLESTPRRAGKSVRLRTAAAYRTDHADLFGEQQLVLLAGKDTAIVLEHHRRTWRWAQERGWALRRRTGAEEIEAPDGSRFIIRGKDSVYGYDTGYGIADEAWGIDPYVVDEGLEPSLLDRRNPQLHLVSTSHRRATPLMRRRINNAIATGFEDPSVLVLVWAAPPGADLGDRRVWRAASPYWTKERETFVASKYENALAGEADPDADDPDPLQGWASQYLNTGWWADPAGSLRGDTAVSESEWRALGGHVLGVPRVAAVEAWFQSGAGLVLAERLPDGRVGVSAQVFGDVPAAHAAAVASGAPVVLVGKSIAVGMDGVEPTGGTTRQAVLELRRIVDDGVLMHDGSAALAEQVLALRTAPGPDGPRLVSRARADLIKACVWAVARARVVVEEPAVF